MIKISAVRWPAWRVLSIAGIVLLWRGRRGATAEQLLEHLGKGAIYNSVAEAWQAAMADAKPEDTVLVCGSFHTVAHVMEVMDAGRTGGE